MGFFTKGRAADQNLRATQRMLDEHREREAEALKDGDKAAIARREELEECVTAARRAASNGENFRIV